MRGLRGQRSPKFRIISLSLWLYARFRQNVPDLAERARRRDPKSFNVFYHVQSYMLIIHRTSHTILYEAYSSDFSLWIFSNKYYPLL